MMQGRNLFEGYLAKSNVEVVAALIEALLSTGPFTQVTVNEGLFDYEPEARSGETLDDTRGKAVHVSDSGNIVIVDHHMVTGLDVLHETVEEAREAMRDPVTGHPRLRSRMAYGEPVFVRISTKQMVVRTRAPVGSRIYWLWTLEGDAHMDRDLATIVEEAKSGTAKA